MMSKKVCSQTFDLINNINFNFNSENVVEVYKSNLILEDCKYIKCSYMGTQIDYPSNFENYGDDKHYCWNHKKMIIRNYNDEIESIKLTANNLKNTIDDILKNYDFEN